MTNETIIGQFVISAARLANGSVMVYDAQGGALPLDYETAVQLRDALNEYLALGPVTVGSLRNDGLEQMFTPKQAAGKPAPLPVKEGYVYLLKAGTGQYKIGMTYSPAVRLKQFQSLPFSVEYVCLLTTNTPREVEGELHRKFADKRLNSEWFNLSDEDVNYIKGLAQ